MFEEYTARGIKISPEELLLKEFSPVAVRYTVVDAIFADSSFNRAVGVAGLPVRAPVTMELLKYGDVAQWLKNCLGRKASVLIVYEPYKNPVVFVKDDKIIKQEISDNLSKKIRTILDSSMEWAGRLNEMGEHISDLRSPSPGPHFSINLLMGNRIDFEHALQTTPKSVVDLYGRGSFRSHADTQVLASRWDMRQEENGFPANRQFYLTEDGEKVFYSAQAGQANIESAICRHSQNHTEITYRTVCGLEIKRLIFILPHREGLPIATEVQRITVKNCGTMIRKLRIVYTGMFGSAAVHALFEDVLYSNVIMQTKIIKNDDGSIAAVSPDYYPEKFREDVRFHTMLLDDGGKIYYPTEFCGSYNAFVGQGTLESPEGLGLLCNKLERKGPGFFALAGDFDIKPGEVCTATNFTGLVSKKLNPLFKEDTLKQELKNLIDRYSARDAIHEALDEVLGFYNKFRIFIELNTEDEKLNSYFNWNLPFQVLYQTFISRAFCQTQKGYRETGFREIQDIYASMYYFAGMGKADLVKKLLKEWCARVFEFGYAYHNFYWEGKEPGKWSDDALWFIQAVYRYINLTGDMGFLEEECPMAGSKPVGTRKVFDTMKAIIRYSSEISIGRHGLPLLDYADWNDCLKLDSDFIDGPEKERLYKEQLSLNEESTGIIKNDCSESVMNGFLLKLAVDQTRCLAIEKGEDKFAQKLGNASAKLRHNLMEHAWKGDFFARVLFNRYDQCGISYLGAMDDGFSPDSKGTYFLNSFSWAVLSDSANEEQIGIMLDTVEEHLKTPYGLKLVTSADLGKVAMETATGHYFPGDRENGAVFKHASMMAAAAMFKAAKEVMSLELASRLAGLAYWTIDTVLPYKTMTNPYVKGGNPRFCTQYNNSETGENIGPMLSGTATWLNLALVSALGVEYQSRNLILNPILRDSQECLKYKVVSMKAKYDICIKKAPGFFRVFGGNYSVKVDGREIKNNTIPQFDDCGEHIVEMSLI